MVINQKGYTMKNTNPRVFKTESEIKVFILYILDNIVYPLEFEIIMSIIEENTDDISFDYAECLVALVDSGHLEHYEQEGVDYYSISDKGRLVAAELYDTLDKDFLERSLKAAIRYISLTDSGKRINSYITETDARRYRVTMEAYDRFGEVMSVSVTVNSRAEAEHIKEAYDAKPEGVYRGVLFSVTGKIEYMK